MDERIKLIKHRQRSGFNNLAFSDVDYLLKRIEGLEARLKYELEHNILIIDRAVKAEKRVEELEDALFITSGALDGAKKRIEELENSRWYLHPESDIKDSPYEGKGKTWIEYAQEEFQRTEKAKKRIEELKSNASLLCCLNKDEIKAEGQ